MRPGALTAECESPKNPAAVIAKVSIAVESKGSRRYRCGTSVLGSMSDHTTVRLSGRWTIMA